jgi:hypothetical protein
MYPRHRSIGRSCSCHHPDTHSHPPLSYRRRCCCSHLGGVRCSGRVTFWYCICVCVCFCVGVGMVWGMGQSRAVPTYHILLCNDCDVFNIISYHIISYHITSHHITPYHITSCHIISHHITSYHIISYHIIHITSYHIISHHARSTRTVLQRL